MRVHKYHLLLLTWFSLFIFLFFFSFRLSFLVVYIGIEGKKKKNNAIVLSWLEIVRVYQPFWQRSRRPIRNHKGCGYRNLDFAELHMTVVNGHNFKTVIFVILRERERKVQKALWGLFAL